MLLTVTTNMPLNYTLEPARPLGVAEVAEMSLETATGGGSAGSILFTVFIAGLYAISGWMLLKRPRFGATLLTRQWPLTLFFIFIAASALWSSFPEKVMNNVIHNAGMLFVTMAAALRYRHDPWLFPKHLGYVLGAGMVLHLLGIIIIPAYTIDWQSRWHGLATHPNPFGAMAYTTLWANAAILIARKNERTYLHWFFAALAVIAMIGADSVTSIMVSIIAVTLICIIKKLEELGVGLQFYSSVLAAIFSLALVVTMVGAAFDLSGLFGLFGRDTNLTGRTSIWEEAFKAIVEHPLLGWSFDDHALLIKQGMPFLSYHNGYLDLAVCGGAISIILLIATLLAWALAFSRSAWAGKGIASYSAPFVIGYLLHNISEASLVSPRSQMWQVFLVLAFIGVCTRWPARSAASGPQAAFHVPGRILG